MSKPIAPFSSPDTRWTLVTGAAGFICFHLIEALLRKGKPVLGIDCFDPFYPRPVKERNLADLRRISEELAVPFQFVEMDILNLSADVFAEHSIQSVYHLAAKAGVRPSIEAPEAYVRANINGTMRILEFCRERSILEIVFGSSSSVYGDDTPVPFSEANPCDRPISPYAATKRACELLCSNYSHLYRLKIAALRFFTVYGPRQRPDLAIHKFARLIHEGRPLTFFGDGSTSRDYTYYSDIIKGVLSAGEWVRNSPSGSYDVFNLGGSRTTTLKDLVRLIETEIGKKAQIQWAERQAGDVERTFADVSKSQRVLGYQPEVGIEAGIAGFVKWFKQVNADRPT